MLDLWEMLPSDCCGHRVAFLCEMTMKVSVACVACSLLDLRSMMVSLRLGNSCAIVELKSVVALPWLRELGSTARGVQILALRMVQAWDSWLRSLIVPLRFCSRHVCVVLVLDCDRLRCDLELESNLVGRLRVANQELKSWKVCCLVCLVPELPFGDLSMLSFFEVGVVARR